MLPSVSRDAHSGSWVPHVWVWKRAVPSLGIFPLVIRRQVAQVIRKIRFAPKTRGCDVTKRIARRSLKFVGAAPLGLETFGS